jgi:THO complex subunit 4
MASKKNMIDMSLDEIAQKEGRLSNTSNNNNGNKEDVERRGMRNRRRGGTGNRREGGGAVRRNPGRMKRDTPYTRIKPSERDEKWGHDGFEQLNGDGTRAQRSVSYNTPASYIWGTMVVIDNLKYDVLEDDLRELMEVIGPIESIKIAYDSSGRSQGKAEVVFRSKYDAEQAVKEYNAVEIDGQKMKVDIGTKVKIMGTRENSTSFRGERGNFRTGWKGREDRGGGKEDWGKEDRRRGDDKQGNWNKDKPRDWKDDRQQNQRDSNNRGNRKDQDRNIRDKKRDSNSDKSSRDSNNNKIEMINKKTNSVAKIEIHQPLQTQIQQTKWKM